MMGFKQLVHIATCHTIIVIDFTKMTKRERIQVVEQLAKEIEILRQRLERMGSELT